ncbi:MAG: alpha/beta hydrolase fold domain-containing protein [Vulcanibacillus sp.]
MSSIESKLLSSILKYSNFKAYIDKVFDKEEFGKNDINQPPKRLYQNFNVDKDQTNGRNTFTISPKSKGSKTYILYLHGGAYINGFNRMHWNFFNRLINATNCTIIAPDYPVAPKYTYKDSFEMVKPIYKKLVSKVGGENIILMGDSSGGGFALALAQNMREDNIENAKQIILLSPWLDITMKNKDISLIDSIDPILSISGLIRAGKAYAGDTNPNNYLLSPINGPIDGLGKISIFIGTKDVLEADSRKFKLRAEEENVKINYCEYKDMIHVWIFFNLPESKQAIEKIVSLINSN